MAKTKFLDRAAILEIADIQEEEVEVPEWGGTVRVRALDGVGRDVFEDKITKVKGKTVEVVRSNARAWLVALCVVDEERKRVFADADVPALAKKSGRALNRVWNVAAKLSGLSDEEVDEIRKNSDGQGGDSASA